MGIAIRRFTEKDRSIYLELAKEFYSSDAVLHPVEECHFERTFHEMMRSEEYVDGFLLEQDGNIAGYVLIAKTFSQEAGGMVAWIEEIYVRPEYQGKGIGTQFLQQYEQSLPEKYQRLRLEVELENGKAIKLYQKLGYKSLAYGQMIKERIDGQWFKDSTSVSKGDTLYFYEEGAIRSAKVSHRDEKSFELEGYGCCCEDYCTISVDQIGRTYFKDKGKVPVLDEE